MCLEFFQKLKIWMRVGTAIVWVTSEQFSILVYFQLKFFLSSDTLTYQFSLI